MDTFGYLGQGFGVALSPYNLVTALCGTLIGTVVGLLPGLLIYGVSYQFVTRSIDTWFDVQVAQGNLPAALASYQAYFAIADRLAQNEGAWKPFVASGLASAFFPKRKLQ